MTLVAMLVAGGIGALLRFEIGGWIRNRSRGKAALGTAVVNVTGTILLALLLVLHRSGTIGDGCLLILGVGFCGAFTTFSTWMVETGELLQAGGRSGARAASLNLVGQLVPALVVAGALLALV